MQKFLQLTLFAVLLSSCASRPQLYKVESVYVCAAEECGQAAQHYGVEQMLAGLRELLATNAEQEFKFCESDPKTRTCLSEGFCYFGQGLFPAWGCVKSGTLVRPSFDNIGNRVHFQSKLNMRVLGIPAPCLVHAVTIAAQSIDEIAWEDESFYCTFTGVRFKSTFNIAVDSVDFDRGIIGGYWTSSAVGAGNGAGSGYGIVVFPKGMARNVDWLTSPQKK